LGEPLSNFAVSFLMRAEAQDFVSQTQEEPMLKKHMAACLVATAFIAAPALAQTSNQPASTTPAGASASAQSGQFLTSMQQNQWRGSKLIGVDIYGANNEKIGDVNEVLIDRQGNADAIVVGVGGFLGIGEKDVAIPFSAVEWKYDRSDLSTASTNRTDGTMANRPAGTAAPGAPAAGTAPAGSAATATGAAPATTGTTGATGTTAANRPAADRDAAMERGYPDHGVIRMSKDQLQNAPTFRYSMRDDRSNAAPARTTAPAATAPATTAPATPPKQ
jgi:sporulation protein YlmC with PRC-barrel domain